MAGAPQAAAQAAYNTAVNGAQAAVNANAGRFTAPSAGAASQVAAAHSAYQQAAQVGHSQAAAAAFHLGAVHAKAASPGMSSGNIGKLAAKLATSTAPAKQAASPSWQQLQSASPRETPSQQIAAARTRGKGGF